MIHFTRKRLILQAIVLFFVVAYTQVGRSFQRQPDHPPQTVNLYTYRAEITSVYDGDTVVADIDLGMNIWLRNERLRLWGIDTPELHRGNDRLRARQARDFLRGQILYQRVVIKTIKDRKGKYGRYLAIIYKDGVNINELMVSESFARRYMTKR